MKKIVFLIFFSATIMFPQKYFNWATNEIPVNAAHWGIISPDSIFIVSPDNNCYRTTDGGINWRPAYGDIPKEILSVSQVKSRTFISLEKENKGILLYSDDLGDKIYEAYVEEPYPIDKIYNSAKGLFGFSKSGDVIFQSTDMGKNWKIVVCTPPGILNVEVNNNGALYAACENSLKKYNLGTGNWDVLFSKSPVGSFKVYEKTVAFVSENRLVYSNNGGLDWDSLACIAMYKDIFIDKFGEFYFSVLFCTETEGEVGLFNVNFANSGLTQLVSKKKGIFDEFNFKEKIQFIEENHLYTQQDEIFPQFDYGFFPLHPGNEWLYQRKEFIPEGQISNYSLVYNKINFDTIVNGITYYSINLDGTAPYYHYNPEENVLRTLSDGNAIQDDISFNYQDNYMQKYILPDNYHFQLAPLLDFTPASMFGGGKGKSYVKNYFCLEVYENTKFVQGVGITAKMKVNFGELSTYNNLIQAKVFNGETFNLFDLLKDPKILLVGEPYIETHLFNLRCRVSNEFILPGESDTLNIIDSVWLEYEYTGDNAGSYSSVVPLICDSISSGRAFYNLNFEMDSLLIHANGMKFRYRVLAKTKGIIPHFSETVWYEIEDTVTSLDNSRVMNEFSLSQNYPNPFNPTTRIEFNIGEENFVDISLYNIAGEKLFTVVKQVYKPGKHEVCVNMQDYSSGIYFVRLNSGDRSISKKIMLLK